MLSGPYQTPIVVILLLLQTGYIGVSIGFSPPTTQKSHVLTNVKLFKDLFGQAFENDPSLSKENIRDGMLDSADTDDENEVRDQNLTPTQLEMATENAEQGRSEQSRSGWYGGVLGLVFDWNPQQGSEQ